MTKDGVFSDSLIMYDKGIVGYINRITTGTKIYKSNCGGFVYFNSERTIDTEFRDILEPILRDIISSKNTSPPYVCLEDPQLSIIRNIFSKTKQFTMWVITKTHNVSIVFTPKESSLYIGPVVWLDSEKELYFGGVAIDAKTCIEFFKLYPGTAEKFLSNYLPVDMIGELVDAEPNERITMVIAAILQSCMRTSVCSTPINGYLRNNLT